MKILFIYQFLTFGGVESVLRNRLKFLTKDSVKVDLLFLYDLGAKEIYKESNIGKIYIERNLKKIKNIITQNSYEYAVSIDTPQIHEVLNSFHKSFNVILEVHTGYYENREYIRKKYLPHNTKLLIVPSRTFKKVIQKELGNLEIPIYELPNPVDMSFFDTAAPNFKNIDSIPILWVGRLDSLKNWTEAVEIFKILDKKDTNRKYEFVFVGGYRSIRFEIENFKIKLEEANIIQKTIWFPFINYKDMPLLYRMVSSRGGLLLSTSTSESFGMTVAESMAARCPIVASNIDAYKELLDNGKGGFLYELGNIYDAVNKINELLNNQDIRNEKIEYSYKKALNNFDPEKNIKEWLEIIKSV